MSRLNILSTFSLAAIGLALTIPAGATTVTIGATAPSGYVATTFGAGNTTSGPGSWMFTGTAGTQNASTSACLDPLGSGTTAYYACAPAQTSITANFASGITGLDFVWGSPDAYNTLTFYTGLNGTGTAESFVPGVAPLVVNIAPLAEAGLFVASPGTTWESVTWSSSFNSFEFASVYSLAATSTSATPEPSSIALLAGGLLALGAGALRRRKA